MKGLIVMNAYPNGEKFYRQSRRIAEEFKGIGIEAEIRRTSEIDAAIRFDGRAEVSGGFDFAVYLDKDKYLGRILEKTGMRLFNSSEAVERCDDKMLTYLALSDSGIEIPESVSAPLCYTPSVHPDESFLSRTAARLGFPLVAKKSFGSFGKDVRLIRTMDELRTTEKDFLYCPHFYQRYLAESAGRDIRVIVIGGRAVAAMERRAQKGEFRSNIELGGHGVCVGLTESFRLAAEKAAEALQLDYCGVDLLEAGSKPVLCEVNSNAFFEGMEAATGMNIARLYAEHIFRTVNG